MNKTVLCFLMAVAALAADKPHEVRIEDPRTVTLSNESKPVDVCVAPLFAVLLALPEQEKIRTAIIGDSASWKLEQSKEPTRFLSIKVKTTDPAQTSLNVISDHDKTYTFRVTKCSDRTDSKVFVEADGQLESDISKPAEWVRADEADHYRHEADEAREQAAKLSKKTDSDIAAAAEAFRAKYPSTLRFIYNWDHKEGSKIGLEQMWDDDKFTYARVDTQEAPAFYEVLDGKPSPIQFALSNGLYISSRKIHQSGYLAIGKTKVNFSKREND